MLSFSPVQLYKLHEKYVDLECLLRFLTFFVRTAKSEARVTSASDDA
jgi:hypothetical protein